MLLKLIFALIFGIGSHTSLLIEPTVINGNPPKQLDELKYFVRVNENEDYTPVSKLEAIIWIGLIQENISEKQVVEMNKGINSVFAPKGVDTCHYSKGIRGWYKPDTSSLKEKQNFQAINEMYKK